MSKRLFTLLSIFIVTVATITVLSGCNSLKPIDLNQTAKQFVVKIYSNGEEGSGSIIGRRGNIYQVLTNDHVVDQVGNLQDCQEHCKIQTHDKKRHTITKIERLNNDANDTDLAIVTFESNERYRVVKLGNSEQLTEGQTIFIAGYPDRSSDTYLYYPDERINGFRSPAEAERGYEIVFSGAIVQGMSGSPILNDQGEIIGIYGRGGHGQPLYGIRINTVIELAKKQNIPLIAFGGIPTPKSSLPPSTAPTPTSTQTSLSPNLKPVPSLPPKPTPIPTQTSLSPTPQSVPSRPPKPTPIPTQTLSSPIPQPVPSRPPKPTPTPSTISLATVYDPPSNIRRTPSVSQGNILCSIHDQVTINIYELTNGWYRTDACNQKGLGIGYISKDQLKLGRIDNASVVSRQSLSSEGVAIVFAPVSNVRDRPNNSGNISCKVTTKRAINIYDYINGWYKTDVCEGEDYIHESQVKF